jgi:thiosulfate/3-mercaptopyruvate sulfurtransferase
MSKRSRPRGPVKAARKVKRPARAAKRRPGRAKPPTRSARIEAPATLVSTDWLAAQLARPQSGRSRVRALDGTWHMPQLERDPRREFEEAHIPGAAFFDVDAIADRTTPLPHMLPGAAQFGRQVGELGISNDDLVVVYDVRGVVSAARVWWTFRAMGHDRVAVLDGGLRKWKAEGRMVETGPAKVAPARFRAHLRRGIVRNLEQVRRNIGTRREQVLDARSRGRFGGTEPEPRAGLRGGHIPGSLNLPYDALYQPDGTLLSPDGLREAFTASGVDPERPVATTCGSGITASVLALGLHLIGHRKVAVYDGSWTEWAGYPDTPVEP